MADNFDTFEVVEENPSEELVVLDEPLLQEPSAALEVVEEDKKLPGSDVILEVEEQAAKDTDWANDGDHSKFIPYIEDKIKNVPRHSGNTLPGCERAVAYLKSCQDELRKAMRTDLGGKIEESKADQLYKMLDEQIERLENQITKLRTNSTSKFSEPKFRMVVDGKCNKCASESPMWHDLDNDKVVCLKCEAEVNNETLVKEANTPVINVYVSAFERAIVGTLINGAVSNGKNMTELYEKLEDKYKFTDREKLAIRQLVSDYGYSQLLDRAKVEENDGENNGELARNYHA